MNEKADKIKEVVPDLIELTKQSINAIGRIFNDVERLTMALHLSEIERETCEEATSPNPERGSIEELELDVKYLRMRLDVVEGKLRKELDYLLGSS